MECKSLDDKRPTVPCDKVLKREEDLSWKKIRGCGEKARSAHGEQLDNVT